MSVHLSTSLPLIYSEVVLTFSPRPEDVLRLTTFDLCCGPGISPVGSSGLLEASWQEENVNFDPKTSLELQLVPTS